MSSNLLVDSDMLLMRCTIKNQTDYELMDEEVFRITDRKAARTDYWYYINMWRDEAAVAQENVYHCFTESSGFRRRIWPQYKAQRKLTLKPVGYKEMKAEILNEDNAYCYKEIEADDMISIFAGVIARAGDNESTFIASQDKDLWQIPGIHVWVDETPPKDIRFNWGTYNSSALAERFTWEQYLSGDAGTDNIPGCPGIGPKTAEKIVGGFDLQKPMDCWHAVVETYKKGLAKASAKDGTPEVQDVHQYALLQARLTRLLRRDEYNFSRSKVTLWNPPTS